MSLKTKLLDRDAIKLIAIVLMLGNHIAAVFLPLTVWLGYRTDKLVTILIMVASSTTSSSYVMARGQGYDGALTANTILLTTFLSAFTLTGWLYVLRSMGLI